jgi:hypothetical protein
MVVVSIWLQVPRLADPVSREATRPSRAGIYDDVRLVFHQHGTSEFSLRFPHESLHGAAAHLRGSCHSMKLRISLSRSRLLLICSKTLTGRRNAGEGLGDRLGCLFFFQGFQRGTDEESGPS